MNLAQRWAAEILLGALTLALGVVEVAQDVYSPSRPASFVLVVLVVAAVVAARRAPALALGLVWFVAVVHVLSGLPLLLVELPATMVVAYGCGRWGRVVTVALSGLSIPVRLRRRAAAGGAR